MTRPPVSLRQHLLTRSDLAKLGIPAGRILTWLGKGWLDQIGSLPSHQPHGDPVFAVLWRELRNELSNRLRELGKDTVVFSPLRVRSLLMRFMLLEQQPAAEVVEETIQVPSDGHVEVDPVTEALLDSDVVDALRVTAKDLEREVDTVLELAREEARLEAIEQSTEIATNATGGPMEDQHPDFDEHEEPTQSRDVDFFDADDLADQLGVWTNEPKPGEVTPTANAEHMEVAEGTAAPNDPDSGSDLAMPEVNDEAPALERIEHDRAGDDAEAANGVVEASDMEKGDAIAETSDTEPPARDLPNEADAPEIEAHEPSDVTNEIDDLVELDLEEVSDPDGTAETETIEQVSTGSTAAIAPGETDEYAASSEVADGESNDTNNEINDVLELDLEEVGDHFGPTETATEAAATADLNNKESETETEGAGSELQGATNDAGEPDPEAEEPEIDSRDSIATEQEPPSVPNNAQPAGALVTEEPQPAQGRAEQVPEANEPTLATPPAEEALANVATGEPIEVESMNPEPTNQDSLDDMLSAAPPTVDAPDEFASAVETAGFEETPTTPHESDTAPTPKTQPEETAVAAAARIEVEPASLVNETTSDAAMLRVESFLGELRGVLVELASRPQAPAIDVQPLVAAVQQGFTQSRDQSLATDTALASLTNQLGDFGDKVEHGVALAVHAALGKQATPTQVAPTTTTYVVPRQDRTTMALFAIGFLVLCWTVVFWFKTGNPRLALGTLIGANVIGCCLLVGRRNNS